MNDKPLGKKCWVVPDGYIPQTTDNDKDNLNGYVSHECLCVLNSGPNDARIELSIYFEDADPKRIEDIIVPARRSCHLRMDQLEAEGQPAIARATPYSVVVKSSEPIVAQMSRLDTTQSNMAFLSTMCYPIPEENV